MNAKLLKRVAYEIGCSPWRFNQATLGRTETGRRLRTECNNSAGCVAAWAVALSRGEPVAGMRDIWERGRQLLDLSEDEAYRLFSGLWPVEWIRAVDRRAEDAGGAGVSPNGTTAARVLELMAADGRVWPMTGRVPDVPVIRR